MAKLLGSKQVLESPVTFSGTPLTGILLEPIEAASLAMMPTTGNRLKDVKLSEIREMALADVNRQFVDRIAALVEHYGVPLDDDWPLAC